MGEIQAHTYFYHALKVVPEICIGCTACMKACPTQAIRIREGIAVINENKCVDCGECAISCPVSAIIVGQDKFPDLTEYCASVILVPGVFFGQFPERISIPQIYSALYSLGFSHVFEVENTTGFILNACDEEKARDRDRMQISSFCPAIIRLIQVRFPSLLDSIVKIKPPMDLAAAYMKQKLENEGFTSGNTGIFYTTPCAAKIASVKSPADETESVIDGVINMQYLFNLVSREIHRARGTDQYDTNQEMLSSEGVQWSLAGGESRLHPGRTMAVDGIHNVSSFLERLENGEFEKFDFLELRACDHGCAGGLLISGNRFLTVERLMNRASKYPSIESKSLYNKLCPENKYLGHILPRPIDPLDRDLSASFRKMKQKQEILRTLPGINCGACGSPDCETLAADIVKDQADISYCVFSEKEPQCGTESSSEILRQVWGERGKVFRDSKQEGYSE